MSDLNKWIGIGRLTRAVELKQTNGGTNIARFSVVSNSTVKRGDEYKDEPNFIDCVAFGKTAENICKYTDKGHRIGIEGRLKYSSWDDQDGKRRSKLEIVVEHFQFLQPKSNASDSGSVKDQFNGETMPDGFNEPFDDGSGIPF